jgi:hypothetical protein
MPQTMNALGIALTVFFGLLNLILYLRGRRRKRLTFTWDSTTLQTRKHPEITMQFKGKPVENLSRFRVAVWNSGNQEIRHIDLPSGTSPIIHLPSAKILSTAILDASVKLSFTPSGNNLISLDFGYPNPKDWGVLEMLCELDESKTFSPHFDARLIGALPAESRKFEKPRAVFGWVGPILSLGLLAAITVSSCIQLLPKRIHMLERPGLGIEIQQPLTTILLIILTIVAVVTFGAIIRGAFAALKASRLPRNAQAVFES